MTMFVGPDTTGRLMEIGTITLGDGRTAIAHALRPPSARISNAMSKPSRKVKATDKEATVSELTPEALADIQRRFENFDPDTATASGMPDDAPPAIMLVQALAARAYHERQAEKVMREAVDAARAGGMSWHRIGVTLGVTGEAVRQRYAHA